MNQVAKQFKIYNLKYSMKALRKPVLLDFTIQGCQTDFQ